MSPNARRLYRRRALRLLGLACALAAALAVLVLALVALTALPPSLREGPAESSLRITDRDGNLLREVRADDGARAQWVPLAELGPLVPQALLAAEDRRFYTHVGVDAGALVRAVLADIAARRVVSGGSTITMQLARVVRPHAHTLWGKLGEMVLALRIEASLSKREILEQYLNRVSFGPGLRGIAAASQAYFDKPPRALAIAEAALLVGLARGPSYYELTHHADRALVRRERVLLRMLAAGDLSAEVYARVRVTPLALQKRASAFGAPHFVRAVLDGAIKAPSPGLTGARAKKRAITAIETTLDSSLQRTAEAAAEQVVSALAAKHVTSASVLAIDNESGDVLAYVGSPDFFDPEAGGQNDGVQAERQPGSTLKPFVYGLALDRLDFTGATVLPDIELHLQTGAFDYSPHDYDEHYRGPVRLREALGNSLNVPAVWTAAQVGGGPLLERLRTLGFDSLREAPDYYGPALALGDGEVTLRELVRAYAVLARGGIDRPLRAVRAVRSFATDGPDDGSPAEAEEPGRAVLDPATCAQITDILRDHDARRASFGERTLLDFDFDVAVKTGTSKGSRDNWTLGYTRQVTVGAWVGNFDGSPMNGTSGITGAGPLFHAVMEAAMHGRPNLPLALGAAYNHGLSRVEVCALSGQAPGPGCAHRVFEWMSPEAKAALSSCSFHERVRLDRLNGLLAGPACAEADVVSADVERYPPEYAAWARAAGRPVAPESSPRCPVASASGQDGAALRIAYVPDGARFALDPERPRALQRLDVTVIAPPPVHAVRLRVDGRVLAEGPAPFAFAWPLEEGDHVLVAEADGVSASPAVRVHVRGW